MVDLSSFLGLCGTILAIGLFTIPILDIYTMYKTRKDVDKFPFFIFIGFSFNCFFWTVYGLKIDTVSVWSCNIYGLITNISFLIVYIICIDASQKDKTIYITGCLATLIILIIFVSKTTFSSAFYGTIANIFNVIAILSTVQKIKIAIELKDKSYIPINFVLICFANSISWVLFSISIGGNMFIFVPNFLGIVLCTVQLYYYNLFNKETPSKEEAFSL
jgi:hypothetical protein